MGILVLIEAVLLLCCAGISLIYQEDVLNDFLMVAAGSALLGGILVLIGKSASRQISRRDGYLIAATAWLLFSAIGMPEGLAIFLECVVIGVCIMLMYAVLAIILIYMERKVCAFFQCRLGPNRVGKYGLMQVFADVFKMLIKEIITLKSSDRLLYNLAPYMNHHLQCHSH